MFGTLSYDRVGREPVFEADATLANAISSTEPGRRGSTIHKACELCRARKLRCSADPLGCDRCKASSSECKYPPRNYRAGRKRPSASRTNSGTPVRSLTPADGATSGHVNVRGADDLGQLEWHIASDSASMQEGAQSSSAHALLGTNYGIGSRLPGAFSDTGYDLRDSSEYDFGDMFEAHWEDSQTARAKATANLDRLLDLSPQSVGWSETAVDSNPELSSGSLSPNNSVGAGRTSTRKNETALHRNNGSCQCLNVIARLLEQVETQDSKSEASIDGLLETCREPLRQVRALLACPHCKSRSECLLLLGMLARSLTAVCSALVHRYVQSRLSGSHHQLTLSNKWPDVRLGAYFVDDEAERSTVIEALILGRLNSLHDFLIDLKNRSKRREGHLAFLMQVEERVKNLKASMPQAN